MEAQIQQAEEEVVRATAEVSAATEAMGRAVAAAEEVYHRGNLASSRGPRYLRFSSFFF